MKAVICNSYGAPGVLTIGEVEQPTPAANEVLIKVEASAVNTADWRLRKGEPHAVRLFFGLTKPRYKIPGGVFAGQVVATGSNVTRFRVGDKVFGSSALGYGFGAYAQYKALPETGVLAIMPANTDYTGAAVLPFGGLTALHFIKQAGINKGDKVLVIGASGAVGTAAVQIARYYGAVVTGVCSGANTPLVKQLGAQQVIDYTQTPLEQISCTYDVIIDTIGKASVTTCLAKLGNGGRLVLVAAGMGHMLHGALVNMLGNKKIISGVVNETAANMQLLQQLTDSGHLHPVIDRTYLLEQIAEAHSYVEQGHKKGNVAITIGH